MKMIRNVVIALAAIVFSSPVMSAQDLSKYRNFSLGASLGDVSKLIDQRPADADVIEKGPAMLQELTWRPSSESDSVEKVRLSFYNGKLYKISVTYSKSSTEGLTTDDMIKAISVKYGVPTTPVVAKSSPVSNTYADADKLIAQWGDAANSAALSRVSFWNAYYLVVSSKQLNDQANASIAEAAKQAVEDAPQKEIARQKKDADELEAARQANLQTIRP